ncbi:hypothetical protein Zmor_007628 [Zophobas morio]|uniref:7tm 6 domain containing protein n=1 Tax=Zophobas morio TaxID=2755281 RepID=A0AA38MPI3_9CUCU|nr:hypothetical protein Zmor_007628 [Zophobas morio]
MSTLAKFNSKHKIGANLFFLRLVGLWPIGCDSYKFSAYTTHAIISIIIIMGSYNFARVMNLFFIYTDLEELTGSIYLTVTDCLVLVKMYFFVQNIRMLKELIGHLDSDLFIPKNETHINLILNGVKAWRISYKSFWVMVAGTLSSWSIVPLFDHDKRRLPLEAWYPYDIKLSPYYEITYICQVVSIWFLATANMNMDSFMAALMMFIGTQCDILCDDLRNLPEKDEFNKKLLDCVTHHKDVLRFAENSNKAYNIIILGQFFTSCLAIALSMFQMTLVDMTSNDGLGFLFYICAMTVQLFQYCWFGNEIEVKVNI